MPASDHRITRLWRDAARQRRTVIWATFLSGHTSAASKPRYRLVRARVGELDGPLNKHPRRPLIRVAILAGLTWRAQPARPTAPCSSGEG